MKTVGIIGGLGPETTAKFYLEILRSCLEKNQEARPPILIWSVPILYKLEEEILTRAEGEEKVIPFLLEAGRRLQKGGANFLVMPCNTLHIFIDEIRKSVDIPVLSIIDETVEFLKGENIGEVGILATASTLKRKLYQSRLEENGIKMLAPDSASQAQLGEIISRLVINKYDLNDTKRLIEMIDSFSEKGVKTAILACTDLQLLSLQHPRVTIYDTMQILADSTVREILKS